MHSEYQGITSTRYADARDTRVVLTASHRSYTVGSSRDLKVSPQCTMGISEIHILLSQPFIGHMRLKVLGISRYHVNERREYERYTFRSYSIPAVAYCWKQSGSKGITSMYNGDQRDMHTDFKASLRSYTIESTWDLKVSPQCAVKIREMYILLLQSLGGSI